MLDALVPAVDALEQERQTVEIVRTGGRLRKVEAFDDDDAALQECPVGAVMARMKLLDGQIVDPDEPDAERSQVFRTIGRQICVVAMEIALANEL